MIGAGRAAVLHGTANYEAVIVFLRGIMIKLPDVLGGFKGDRLNSPDESGKQENADNR